MNLRWVAALLAVMASSCGTAAPRPLITHAAQLAWPPPPASPRVRYVGQIRGLTMKSGFVTRALIGDETRTMDRPYAMVTTPQDVLVVTDLAAGRLNFFDLRQQKHTVVDHHHGIKLLTPVGVAADTRGRVYVADSTIGRIFVFDHRGKALNSFGDDLKRPTGLAMDRKRGHLYVVDTAAHQVQVRSVPDGRRLRSFGGRGTGLGQLNFPTHAFYSAKLAELLVCDTLNFRIQQFDAKGTPIGSFGESGTVSGTLAKPKGIAVDSDGHVYVADALFDAVQVFDRQGRLLLYFGETGSEPAQLMMPTGIHIDDKDRLYVANTLNGRVEIFQYVRSVPPKRAEAHDASAPHVAQGAER